MACEVCEHCQSPVLRDERAIREGFSYHKKCHKCYVCSETNLQNAEVFKGVIFCSSCAQRIFQGCSTARKTKTMHTGRARRTRFRSHRRRDRLRLQDRKVERSIDGVIELAGMAGSTTDSDDMKKQKHKTSKVTISSELALQVGNERRDKNCYYLQEMKKDSTEMGTTTDVTQELLKQINCPIPDCRAKHYTPKTLHPPRKYNRRKEIAPNNKSICSDLRIAELGASTEIANMALRKKSELPVIIKSDTRLKGRHSFSLSALNQESDFTDVSGDKRDWMESTYSTIEESETTNWMDRRLGSILKLPIRLFKKNILNRSSLISVLMSSDDERRMNLFRRFKEIFNEEIINHQGRGVRRLYSTINRKRKPHKLGWVELVANVSKVIRDQHYACMSRKRCRHFSASHSYRCMRTQVMKLAGPTKSELACCRSKIKKFVAPQFLRNLVNNKKDYPSIKMSQACGSDRRSTKS